MKKILLLIVMIATACMNASAQFEDMPESIMLDGSVACLKGEKYLYVSWDFSKTIYDETRTLDVFLSKAYRDDNWERKSFERFNDYFNQKAFSVGLKCVFKDSDYKANYELHVVVDSVNTRGYTVSTIYLKDVTTGDTKASFLMYSYDGDSDDPITLGDALSNTGWQMAKMIVKKLKKCK